MNLDELLRKHIPYRLASVDALNLALKMREHWQSSSAITIEIDGKLAIEGNLNAIANPMIEAGVVHCRALLEFLGLAEKEGRLVNRKTRKPDDFGIEDFSNAMGPLKMLDIEDALQRYSGKREDAELAIMSIFYTANKGLAHITKGSNFDIQRWDLIEIASRGIPALVISYLYTPLNLLPPDYKIKTRALSQTN